MRLISTRWNKQTFVFVLVLAFFLAACSPDQAPTPDERAERLTAHFNEADTNDDGVLSVAEIDAEIATDFENIDYNNDGAVTIEDIHNEEQGLPDGVELNPDLSHHLPYDQNSDDTISSEEYRSHIESELLAEMDSNSDDRISFAEYSAFHDF